jgi:hypothetical protein
MLSNIKLTQDLSFFLPPFQDYSVHKGSCISYQRVEQNELYDSYGNGYSYDENNTVIQQIWHDVNHPLVKEISEQLNIEPKTCSSILQPPGNVITLHRDTFFKFKELYPDDTRLKVRANIYLEDWKIGHMIQYQDINDGKKWKTSVDWKVGEGFLWSSDVLHLSANAGMKDKYTLQISGFLNQ